MEERTIVCRCSDVTLEEIRKLIKQGYSSLDEIKRISRAGMGPCQGKTCSQIILKEIALATGKDISELELCTSRPPVKAIKLKSFAEGGTEDD